MFKPGQSGNPNGRPKGTKNISTRLLSELESDLPELLEATKAKALEGDTGALRLLLERMIPAKKSESKAISIPNLAKAKTLTEKAEVIIQAIGNGDLPPDVGSQLISSVGSVAKIIEIDELVKRIESLENAKQ